MKIILNGTKDEKSLLLYLETCVVDDQGLIDSRKMNIDDWRKLELWTESRYVQSGRVASAWIKSPGIKNHWVVLSDLAWRHVGELRREKADRVWGKRNYKTTSEVNG